jgi:hypothetical protein
MHRYWDRLQRYPSENVDRRRGSSCKLNWSPFSSSCRTYTKICAPVMADARRQRTRRRSSPHWKSDNKQKLCWDLEFWSLLKLLPAATATLATAYKSVASRARPRHWQSKEHVPPRSFRLAKNRTDERRPKLTSLVSSLLQALAGTVLPMFETCQLAPNGRSQAETRAVDIQSWAVSDFHDNLPVQRKG